MDYYCYNEHNKISLISIVNNACHDYNIVVRCYNIVMYFTTL